MKRYEALIEAYVYDREADIETECVVGVTHCINKRPDRFCKDSDVDFYGYQELEYEILHKDLKPAPELEAKLSKVERECLEEKIFEEMGEER